MKQCDILITVIFFGSATDRYCCSSCSCASCCLPKSLKLHCFKAIRMKFGKIVPQVNVCWLMKKPKPPSFQIQTQECSPS